MPRIAALVLLLTAIALTIIVMSLQRPELVDLRTTDQLAVDQPTRRAMNLYDGTLLNVRLVYTGGKSHTINAGTPFGTHCSFE